MDGLKISTYKPNTILDSKSSFTMGIVGHLFSIIVNQKSKATHLLYVKDFRPSKHYSPL
jgi:hypothetical protein